MEKSIKLFVICGTQKFPFSRLTNALNLLVKDGIYQSDDIIIQSSVNVIKPMFRYYELMPVNQFNKCIDKAELIITHAGVNSIITCMNKKKPLIIAPRKKKYGEHIDDHQIEIANLMRQKFDVVTINDFMDLQALIKEAQGHIYKPWKSGLNDLIISIRNEIEKYIKL